MAGNRATPLAQEIKNAWDDLDAYLKTLTPEQLTALTDAGGWSVKDHVIHLAAWDDSVHALLEKQSRYERMGISKAVWDQSEINAINAAVWELHKDRPLDEVLKIFQATNQKLVEKVQSMSDSELSRQYKEFQADPARGEQIVGEWISNATHKHYGRHRPWIKAIIDKG